MKMNANINWSTDSGFILTEENLLKVEDIIKNRLSAPTDESKICYKVQRKDSLSYETEQLQKVFEEENSKRNTIEEVEISLCADELRFSLSFSHKSSISMRIESPKKDQAYLLSSDLKNYINGEIIKFKLRSYFKRPESIVLMAFIGIVAIAFSAVLIENNLAVNEIQDQAKIESIVSANNLNSKSSALESEDLALKLNYLIALTKNHPRSPSVLDYTTTLCIFITILFMFFHKKILSFLSPRIFCWGKEKIYYERRESIKNKIIWGIILTFILGIPAAIVGAWITK